jgi:hypothetical protein
MDCLQPPLNESPPGKWHCPMCPPLDFQFAQSDTPEQDPTCEHLREMSIASTSYSHEVPAASFNKRKGKSNFMFTDESEVDSPVSKKIGRGKKLKGKGYTRMSDTDRDEVLTHGTRSVKRMKLKVTTPPPPRMVVRLRLPANKGKGKEREEEESLQKDIFEDILTLEDRDTTRTVIEASDKSRYEKSRTAAEVRMLWCITEGNQLIRSSGQTLPAISFYSVSASRYTWTLIKTTSFITFTSSICPNTIDSWTTRFT